MKCSWIENYAGTWHDSEGRVLIITICDDENATVDLLFDGDFVLRAWCADEPAAGLAARYNPADGPDLDIDLGRPGFSLSVNFESAEPPYEPESLSVGVSRYESDLEAERFINLFGKLGRYRRKNAEQSNSG